jgi:hypothetical protein
VAIGLIRTLLRSSSALAEEISEIDMSRKDGPVLYTVDGVEVRLGSEEWEDRLARLEGVLAQLGRDGGGVGTVDLRFRDQVVLQTPLPGKRGTLGQNRIENLGSWSADMAIQKRVRVGEDRSVTIRLDATNIFNHPTPGQAGAFAPAVGASDLSLQSGNPFGAVTSKAGQRRFQFKARIDF